MCEEILYTIMDMISDEINALDIDPDVKEGIMLRVKYAREEELKRDEKLLMCHCEMDRLRDGIVEQAKIIGKLQRELDAR